MKEPLMVKDVQGKITFEFPERFKRKYQIVENIIKHSKINKMQNDYGVYKGDIEAGTDEWLVSEMPVQLGTASDAIDSYSMAEAITIADYLSQTQGTEFRFGRPNDRHGS